MIDTSEENIAAIKYNYFKESDPFYNEIPAALLNSADVENYIFNIGMIHPFKKEFLSGTTISLTIGGTYVYWNEKDEKIKKYIAPGEEFKLKRNTIAYVPILEHLRLPRYIIARFNLKVTNTYKGLLLGTGPIVDPGFDGNLNIPLHNLTNGDYIFYGGEPLIEMEFTKLSPNDLWKNLPANLPVEYTPQRIGSYEKWKPKDETPTIKRDIEYYLRRANMGRSIESSLPALENETRNAIDDVEKIKDKVDTALGRYNVGLLFSFATLLSAIVAIVNIFRGDIKEIKDKKLDEQVTILKEQHRKDSIRIDSLRNTVKFK